MGVLNEKYIKSDNIILIYTLLSNIMTLRMFANYPFELNIKYIIFSVVIIGLFLYQLLNMNIYLKLFTTVLLTCSYISMVWYNYKFDCQKSSSFGITNKIKSIVPSEKNLDWFLINIYNLLILSPLLLYVGINKDNSNPLPNILLIVNFAIGILYYGINVAIEFNVMSYIHIIVNISRIYMLVKENKPEWFYNSLFGVGIYTSLKHGIYLIQSFYKIN